jgi:sugar-specific transcriptional regulator TrmB
MYQESLKKLGLTEEQATIYNILLTNGPLIARKIALLSGLKRGFVYKNLDQLVELNLVEKIEKPSKATVFAPKHPGTLLEVLEQKKREIQATTESFRGIIGQMTSDFNLITGKPSIQFYEGTEGIKTVLEDSLYAKGEILNYVDLESIQKYIPNVNEWYVKEREKDKIKNRGLVLDTPFNRNFLKDYHPDITDTKLLPIQSEPFSTIMKIYNDKISYITLGEHMIGVIITGKAIADMHRKLFEFTWSQAHNIGL